MSDAIIVQVPTCPSKQVEEMRSSANPELYSALQKVGILQICIVTEQ